MGISTVQLGGHLNMMYDEPIGPGYEDDPAACWELCDAVHYGACGGAWYTPEWYDWVSVRFPRAISGYSRPIDTEDDYPDWLIDDWYDDARLSLNA